MVLRSEQLHLLRLQQIVRHKLTQHGVVRIPVPMRLHVFFAVPMRLAFQMTADQAHRALHNRHRVAIGIGRHRVKLPAFEGRAIVKIHVPVLTAPVHRGDGAVGRTYIGFGTLDVLHTARTFEQIEVIGIGPISPHANTQVLATTLHKTLHVGQVGFQDTSKRRGLAIAARKHHKIYIVKKSLAHLMPREQFNVRHGRQGGYDPVDRVSRTRRVV